MNMVALRVLSWLGGIFTGVLVPMGSIAVNNKLRHNELRIIIKNRPALARYRTSNTVQLGLSEPYCPADIYSNLNINNGIFAEEIKQLKEVNSIELRDLDENLESICKQLEPINPRTSIDLCELCKKAIDKVIYEKEECEKKYKQNNELSYDEIIDLGNKIMDAYGVLSKSEKIISAMGQSDAIFTENNREVFNCLCDMHKNIRKNAVNVMKVIWEQNESDDDKIHDYIRKMNDVFLLMRPLDTENVVDKDESYLLLFNMFEKAIESGIKICEDLFRPFIDVKAKNLMSLEYMNRFRKCAVLEEDIENLWNIVYEVNVVTGQLYDLRIKNDIISRFFELSENVNRINNVYSIFNSDNKSVNGIMTVERPLESNNDVSPISKKSSSGDKEKKLEIRSKNVVSPTLPMSPTFKRSSISPRAIDFNELDDISNEKQEILVGDNSPVSEKSLDSSAEWNEIERKLDENSRETEAYLKEPLPFSPEGIRDFDNSMGIDDQNSTSYSGDDSVLKEIDKSMQEATKKAESGLKELFNYKNNNSFDDLENSSESSWDASAEMEEIEKNIEETNRLQEELERDIDIILNNEIRYEYSEKEEDRDVALNMLDKKRRKTADERKKNNMEMTGKQENLANVQEGAETIKR